MKSNYMHLYVDSPYRVMHLLYPCPVTKSFYKYIWYDKPL